MNISTLRNSRLRDEQGFTLIELLIVIVVLGILSTIVLFGVGSTKEDADKAKGDSDKKVCATAFQAAKAKYGAAGAGAKIDEFTAEGGKCTAAGLPA